MSPAGRPKIENPKNVRLEIRLTKLERGEWTICWPGNRKYPDEPLKLWSDGQPADESAELFTDADLVHI